MAGPLKGLGLQCREAAETEIASCKRGDLQTSESWVGREAGGRLGLDKVETDEEPPVGDSLWPHSAL